MARVFSRIRSANRRPTPEEVLADIVEYHRERPGITEATLGACTTADGRTGYDVLIEKVPATARSVLDLGCGNGPMLERLLARRPGLERAVGVDLCSSDLELARQRLADGRVELRCEPGQRLGIETESVDAVLSHHAFYLMDPVEPVVRQIARVLRPGGVFAFVTSSPDGGHQQPFAEMMRRFSELTSAENPFFRGWGDPRVWTRSGLRSLFVESGAGFDPTLEVRTFALELREPKEALCARLMGFFYSVELQSPETREQLRQLWLDALSRTEDASETARLAVPLACVSFVRSA